MNWQENQDSSMVECQARDLEVRVRVLVQVQIFLLKFNKEHLLRNLTREVSSDTDVSDDVDPVSEGLRGTWRVDEGLRPLVEDVQLLGILTTHRL